MGIEELKAKIKSDKAFAENFKSVKSPEEAVEVAKKLGYNISVEDCALSADELKAVAGGAGRPKEGSGVIVDWS